MLAAILFISNPDQAKYKEKINTELKPAVMDVIKKHSKSKFVSDLFSNHIDNVIERQIIVDNYVFFSVCKIKISEDEIKPLGIGVLNHVFLFVDQENLREAYAKKFINNL